MINSKERGLIDLRIDVTINFSACDVGRLEDTFTVKLSQVPSRLLQLLLGHLRPVKVRQEFVPRAVKCLKSASLDLITQDKLPNGCGGSPVWRWCFHIRLDRCHY